MKYPVLLKIKTNKFAVLDAERIHAVESDNPGSTVFYPNSQEYYESSEPVDEIYQKIQDALNPGSNSEALKQQNSQLIQVIDNTKSKLEAYKGEIEDIRELIGANEDESTFDEVQRLIESYKSRFNESESQFKGLADGMKDFMQWTIQYIPKDLHPQVEKTINDLKAACNSKS